MNPFDGEMSAALSNNRASDAFAFLPYHAANPIGLQLNARIHEYAA